MLPQKTIKKAFESYLEFGGNLSEVFRQMKDEISYGSLRNLKRDSEGEWENALKEYIEKLAREKSRLTDLSLKFAKTLDLLLDKLTDAVGNEKDVNALTQAVHGLKSGTDLLNKFLKAQTKDELDDKIMDNKIIQFLMRDRELKPLLLEKKEKLKQFITDTGNGKKKRG